MIDLARRFEAGEARSAEKPRHLSRHEIELSTVIAGLFRLEQEYEKVEQ